jgi:hypothetical protein
VPEYVDPEVFAETYPVTVKEYRIGDKGIYQSGIRQGVRAEQERFLRLLENLAYIDDDGHEMISEFKSDLIARVREE